ncbi:peptidylprolyl isomerase [Hirschia baltica]|uniref:Parvulin-like PPIase n=1 Tax=Hirschia baltica (strain ATCC 49814 / DSM 5838 / IFAM 1418) TaxID=582402 RepID=C6XPX1_HIRBI|nr:peptidylprolyl isomerase [Hirschia baltica]ACT58488.1 PpiC-type peptidyl-prolyl cis-trans isomerase [Hirschia baltica ATCC 49814]
MQVKEMKPSPVLKTVRGMLGLLGALIVLSACEDEQAILIQPTPTAADDAVIAATVDGYPIYVADIEMEAESQGILLAGRTLDPSTPEFTRILNSLIDDHLLAKEAEKQNLHTDPYVQHRLKVIRERLLGNMLLSQGVDEASIQKYYETSINLKQLQLGEEYRVRQIVLPTLEAANAMIKQMTAETDFSVLASNRSIDEETRLEGGDLGFINPETAPLPLANAIQNTAMGGVSKPFETRKGWVVIKVVEKRPEPLPTLQDLRPQIWDFLIASELERLLKKLHKDSAIIRSFEEVEGPINDAFSNALEIDEQNSPILPDEEITD